MEETIKDKEIIAYKGMNSDMSCGYFQYEIGKTYKTDKIELYECGFHACLNPIDVLEYYFEEEGSRYFKVKLSEEITKCDEFDTNVAATEITILEEIPADKFLTNTEWWKNKNVLDLLYYLDGFARIRNCDKQYNFINKQGKLLSEQWFDWSGIFYDGFARVQRGDGLWNLIDTKGKILSDEWFEDVFYLHEGFAVVQRVVDKKYNFIDANGKLLSDEWFEWADDFSDGFAYVKRTNGDWVKIDKTGKLIKNCNRIWKRFF